MPNPQQSRPGIKSLNTFTHGQSKNFKNAAKKFLDDGYSVLCYIIPSSYYFKSLLKNNLGFKHTSHHNPVSIDLNNMSVYSLVPFTEYCVVTVQSIFCAAKHLVYKSIKLLCT